MSIHYSPCFTSSGCSPADPRAVVQGEGKGTARIPPCGGTPWPVRRRPVQTAAVLAVPATGLRPGLPLAPAPACLAAWPPLAGAAARHYGLWAARGTADPARPMRAGQAAVRSRRRPATARLRGGGGVAGALGRAGEGAGRGRTRARAGSRQRLGQVGNRLKFGPCEGIGPAVGWVV